MLSQIESIKSENFKFAESFKDGNLPIPPSKKVAVLACMDVRLLVDKLLGLKIGEAHIIRNAGGIATEDVIRSLIISHELLGTQEIVIVNHTDCGMVTFKDQDLQNKLAEKYKLNASDINFHTFANVEDNVREQIKQIKSNPFLSEIASVTGFVYDVSSGKINEIV